MKKSRIKSMKYLQSIFNISIHNNKQLDAKSEGISNWSFWLADIRCRWIVKRNSCWFLLHIFLYILDICVVLLLSSLSWESNRVLGYVVSQNFISFLISYERWLSKGNYWSTILMGYKFNIEIVKYLDIIWKTNYYCDKWLVVLVLRLALRKILTIF